MSKTKEVIPDPCLDSWNALNDKLRTADEAICNALIAQEKASRNRRTFIKRIHSRLNKVRADRERQELTDDFV